MNHDPILVPADVPARLRQQAWYSACCKRIHSVKKAQERLDSDVLVLGGEGKNEMLSHTEEAVRSAAMVSIAQTML